mmetsp:Transcript_1875/g.2112  ORF Transcript_1875/g.2112 Transcript_1875/m.2112 type:complete len:91 (+) Transcript_1875:52-324(+)
MRISNLSLIVLLLQQVCENDAFSSLLNQQPKATKSASLNRSNNKQHKFPLTTRYSSTLDIPTTTTTTTKTVIKTTRTKKVVAAIKDMLLD